MQKTDMIWVHMVTTTLNQSVFFFFFFEEEAKQAFEEKSMW